MLNAGSISTNTLYISNDEKISAQVAVDIDTVWASVDAMSAIFSVDKSEIESHLKSIFTSRELNEKEVVCRKEGIKVYNVDVIFSVGYRANPQAASQFRKWVTEILRQLIQDGYVLDEKRLRDDPEKLNQLAAKIRTLRANEKNIYASVRECFKLASSDYEPSSKEVRSFYALLQDKFHHAVTRMTSSQLILDRAYHADENMGLESLEGVIPTLKESRIGKNYLKEDEIYRLHLLSEQFLLYAESTALKGSSMKMSELHEQLDNLLKLNGYPVFEGYKDYLKEDAESHAKREYESYLEIKRLEHLGIKVDLENFYLGHYQEYKEQTSQISLHQLKKGLIEKSDTALLTETSNNAIESTI